MPTIVYESTDAGAAVLNGLVSSLINVFDQCLVTGNATAGKAAAGWTKPYTGTNLAVFRNAVAGTGHYLRVNDAAPNTTVLAREAQVRGNEAMSAISTGTGPFPTVASPFAGEGVPIRKSNTLDATARQWLLIADDKTFSFFTRPGDFSGWTAFHFGDTFSLAGAGDVYRSIIIGRSAQGSEFDDVENLHRITNSAALVAGHWMPRTWHGGFIGAINVGKHGDGGKSANSATLNGVVTYPNRPDNSLQIAQLWVHEDNGSTMLIRGRLRGLYHFLHPVGVDVNDGDTFAGGAGTPYAGKNFRVLKPSADRPLAVYIVETSNWESN